MPPPALTRALEEFDVRSLPTVQADGADGNRPSRARPVRHLGRKFAAPETIFGMSERAIKTLSARTGSNWKLTEWP